METNKLAKEIVCKYLPYNLKVQCEGDKYFVTAIYLDDKKYSIHIKATDDWFNIDVKITEIKPILRPLSDLTKEIVVKGYNDNKPFTPISHIADFYGFTYHSGIVSKNLWGFDDCINGDAKDYYFGWHKEWFYFFIYDADNDIECCTDEQLDFKQEVLDLLHQWHFDLYNGIKNGWAIDINTLSK